MFRNLNLYRLPNGISASPEELASQLAAAAFRPCGEFESTVGGWVEPFDGAGLVFAQGKQRLLCYQTEDKILPAAYVQRVALERAEQIEEQQGRKVGRKEMKEIREAAAHALLPRAFTRIARTFVWIDNERGWIGVDGNETRASAALEALRRCMTMIPQIAQPRTVHSPSSSMAAWLAADSAPSPFTIDQDLELRSAAEGQSAIRYTRHSLEGAEIREHIAGGKIPTRTAMTWNDRISFILTDRMELKRIAFLDILKEEIAQQSEEDAAAARIADFTIGAGELARLIADLVTALGGEVPDIDQIAPMALAA